MSEWLVLVIVLVVINAITIIIFVMYNKLRQITSNAIAETSQTANDNRKMLLRLLKQSNKTNENIEELKTNTNNAINQLKTDTTHAINEIRLFMNEDKMKLKFQEEKLHKLDMKVNKLNTLLIEMDNNCAAIHGKKLSPKTTHINISGNNNNLAEADAIIEDTIETNYRIPKE